MAVDTQTDERNHRPKTRSAHNQRPRDDWSRNLTRLHGELLTAARTDAERAELDAEFERLREAGPDFERHHCRSDFGRPPDHKIDRNLRVKILVAYGVLVRGLRDHCRKPKGQGVSKNVREVLAILLSFAVKYGQVYPSLDTIARLALCSRRTVLRAIEWLEKFGFVKRYRRLVRQRGPWGVRVRQDSNAYRVGYPTGLGGMAQKVFGRIFRGNVSKVAGAECQNFTASCFTDKTPKKEPAERANGLPTREPGAVVGVPTDTQEVDWRPATRRLIEKATDHFTGNGQLAWGRSS